MLRCFWLSLVLATFAGCSIEAKEDGIDAFHLTYQTLTKRGSKMSKGTPDSPPITPRTAERNDYLRNLHHYHASSSESDASSHGGSSSGYTTPSDAEEGHPRTPSQRAKQGPIKWKHDEKVRVRGHTPIVTLKKPVKTKAIDQENNLQLWQGTYQSPRSGRPRKIKVFQQTDNGHAQQYIGQSPITRYHDVDDPQSPHASDRPEMSREEKAHSNAMKAFNDSLARKDYVKEQARRQRRSGRS